MPEISTKLENGLFIFRRDLRIVDNNGLNVLSSLCNNIYTIFIFTPEQVSSGNKYKSDNAVQFMIESLENLSTEISKRGGQLHTFYGNNNKVIAELIKSWDINVVAFNLDVTPYSRVRDDKILQLCQKMKVFLTYDHDYYLQNPDSIVNGSGNPYVMFTPYYEKAKKIKVQPPAKLKQSSFKSSNAHITNKLSLQQAMNKFVKKENPDILLRGGRTEALKQLIVAAKNIAHYSSSRNDPSRPTSQLSAYIKFGCISIREVYSYFKSNQPFIRQLYWRDFYSQVMYNFPHVLGKSLKPKYDQIRWLKNERLFNAWTKGITGIPFVDASQRQLLKIGWTHNRCRMISSSILTKILLIDWREGEQFYAQHLLDYDVANNNGGWQFSSGSGADSQPYFRYFNPYLQSKEHDPECKYIKQWIPELKDVPEKDIHNWETKWENHKECGYPKPIVNYAEQKEKSLKMYKEALY